MTEDEEDEFETRCTAFTAILLEACRKEFGDRAAMRYAGVLATMGYVWVTKHHGPQAALDLVQRISEAHGMPHNRH